MIIEDMDRLSISDKIKRRRLEAGLSLSQLAQRVNTSAATLSRYENGWQRFEIYTLRKIATALGCRLVVDMVPMEVNLPRGGRQISDFSDLQRLFWDCRLEDKDLERYPVWVVERVLEYGSLKDISFLVKRLGRRHFLETVSRVQFKSAKTRNFWKSILERENIACTKKSSPKRARPFLPG
jgi:transcriptional regulator with XRE-family HTH domain